jgi:hypothetical protein
LRQAQKRGLAENFEPDYEKMMKSAVRLAGLGGVNFL